MTETGIDAFELIFGFLIFGSIALVIGMFIASAIIPPELSYYDTSILSVNDGSEVSGSFSLGSGSIHENPVFVYYKVDGKGYRLETVDADETLIVEDEETSPYLRTLMSKRWGGMPVAYAYEFHVPKKTVVRKMILDANLRT